MSQVAEFTARVRQGLASAPARARAGAGSEQDPVVLEATPRLRPLQGLRLALRPFLVNSGLAAVALQSLRGLLPAQQHSWYFPLCTGLALRLCVEVLLTGA